MGNVKCNSQITQILISYFFNFSLQQQQQQHQQHHQQQHVDLSHSHHIDKQGQTIPIFPNQEKQQQQHHQQLQQQLQQHQKMLDLQQQLHQQKLQILELQHALMQQPYYPQTQQVIQDRVNIQGQLQNHLSHEESIHSQLEQLSHQPDDMYHRQVQKHQQLLQQQLQQHQLQLQQQQPHRVRFNFPDEMDTDQQQPQQIDRFDLDLGEMDVGQQNVAKKHNIIQ